MFPKDWWSLCWLACPSASALFSVYADTWTRKRPDTSGRSSRCHPPKSIVKGGCHLLAADASPSPCKWLLRNLGKYLCSLLVVVLSRIDNTAVLVSAPWPKGAASRLSLRYAAPTELFSRWTRFDSVLYIYTEWQYTTYTIKYMPKYIVCYLCALYHILYESDTNTHLQLRLGIHDRDALCLHLGCRMAVKVCCYRL